MSHPHSFDFCLNTDADSVTAEKVHMLVRALLLCHNVTPTTSQTSPESPGVREVYQASSPDEIALVQFVSESLDYSLEERYISRIVLKNPIGETEVNEILIF